MKLFCSYVTPSPLPPPKPRQENINKYNMVKIQYFNLDIISPSCALSLSAIGNLHHLRIISLNFSLRDSIFFHDVTSKNKSLYTWSHFQHDKVFVKFVWFFGKKKTGHFTGNFGTNRLSCYYWDGIVYHFYNINLEVFTVESDSYSHEISADEKHAKQSVKLHQVMS